MITIGTRVKYLRLKHGMTMKYLEQQVGFPVASADVRIAQYESGNRTPKADLIQKLADVLGVPSEYLSTPIPSSPSEIQVMNFWNRQLYNTQRKSQP